MHRLLGHRLTKFTASLLGVTLLSAGCTNPFSHSSNAIQSFTQKDYACDALPLGKSEMDAPLLRALVNCLNSGGQLQGIADWFSTISDKDLQPVADFIQKSTLDKPDLLYSMIQLFNKKAPDTDPTSLFHQAAYLLGDPTSNAAVVKLLSKIDFTMIDQLQLNLTDGDLQTLLNGLRIVVASQIFQDAFHSPDLNFNRQQLAAVLTSVVQNPPMDLINLTRNWVQNDGILESLYATAQIPLDSNPVSANFISTQFQTADMFATLFAGSMFDEMRTSLSDLKNPIPCFNGAKNITAMDQYVLNQLQTINKVSDLTMLLFTSKALCTIPPTAAGCINDLFQLQEHPGFTLFRTGFIKLFATPDGETIFLHPQMELLKQATNGYTVKELSQALAFLTLIETPAELQTAKTIFLKIPVQTIQASLEMLKSTTADDWMGVFPLLDRLFAEDNGNGSNSVDFLLGSFLNHDEDVGREFWNRLIEYKTTNPQIAQSINAMFNSPKAAGALNNVAALITGHQLESLVQTLSTMLAAKINEGAHDIKIETVELPEVTSSRLAWSPLQSAPSILPLALAPEEACHSLDLNWNWTTYDSNNDNFNNLSSCVQSWGYNKSPAWITTLAQTKTESGAADPYLYRFYPAISVLNLAVQSTNPQTVNSRITNILELLRVLPNEIVKNSSILLSLQSAWQTVYASIKNMPAFTHTLTSITNSVTWPETYAFLTSWISPPDSKPAVIQPVALQSFIAQKMANTEFVIAPNNPNQVSEAVDFSTGLKLLFNKYCASLNKMDPTCLIDDAQVDLYNQVDGANLLAQSIITEFWNSSNSWMDPTQHWKWTNNSVPTTVQDIRYEFNPFANTIYNQNTVFENAMVKGLTSFNDPNLQTFFEYHAKRQVVLPFYNFESGFPANSIYELKRRVHIRMMNDLDRFEQISVLAAFIPHKGILPSGLISIFANLFERNTVNQLEVNQGESLFVDLALSWGDVPRSQWPSGLIPMLSALGRPAMQACSANASPEDTTCIRTLKLVQQHILNTMNSFSTQFNQFGGMLASAAQNCDPRKGKLSSCNPGLSDSYARVQNLTNILPLLLEELPTAQGGHAGLEFLRNMFWELENATPPGQRLNFSEGTRIPTSCMNTIGNAPNVNCAYDFVDIVFRLGKIGVFHQIGMGIVKGYITGPDLYNALQLMNSDPTSLQALSAWISSQKGLNTLSPIVQSLVNRVGNFTPQQMQTLGQSAYELMHMSANLSPAAFSVIYPAMTSALTNAPAVWGPSVSSVFEWLTQPNMQNFLNLTPTQLDKISPVLVQLDPSILTNALTILPTLASNESQVDQFIQNVGNLTFSSKAKGIVVNQLNDFRLPEEAPARAALKEFLNNGGTSAALDALSDNSFVQQSVNALTEIVNQGGTGAFVDRCETAFGLK